MSIQQGQQTKTNFQLSNDLYEKIKFVIQVILPAAAVLYASLAEYWNLPNVKGVVGTIAAVGLFLGVVMRISSRNYEPPINPSTPVGSFVVTTTPEGRKTVKLELDRDPEDVAGSDVIAFNLQKESVEDFPDTSPVPEEAVDADADREANSH